MDTGAAGWEVPATPAVYMAPSLSLAPQTQKTIALDTEWDVGHEKNALSV